jgi:periplasmic protein TonB
MTGFKRVASSYALVGVLGFSFVCHAATLVLLPKGVPRPPRRPPQKVALVEWQPPPQPTVERELPPPPPVKQLRRVAPKTVPVVVSEAPAAEAPPASPSEEPETKVLPIVGISFESTAATGGLAVPIGNSSMGPATRVVDPSQVPAAAPGGSSGAGFGDREPSPLEEIRDDVAYPSDAKAAGVEGEVVCKVLIEADGTVSKVSVLRGPSASLNEAARNRLLRSRWAAGFRGGQRVAMSIIYSFVFELD